MRNAKREIADSPSRGHHRGHGGAATLKSRFVPWLSRDDAVGCRTGRRGNGRAHPPDGAGSLAHYDRLEVLDFARKKWPKRKLDPYPGGGANWPSLERTTGFGPQRMGLDSYSDSTLSDEIVVLTSHYDHVGVDKSGDVFMEPTMTAVEP